MSGTWYIREFVCVTIFIFCTK